MSRRFYNFDKKTSLNGTSNKLSFELTYILIKPILTNLYSGNSISAFER